MLAYCDAWSGSLIHSPLPPGNSKGWHTARAEYKYELKFYIFTHMHDILGVEWLALKSSTYSRVMDQRAETALICGYI
jgi:hypothetical protein